MLCKEKRTAGTVWVFRWSEEVNGQRRQHKDVIGSTKQFKTEAAAEMEADRLRCKLNEDKQQLSLKHMTFGELVNHYLNHELPSKSKSTRKTNKMYINNWIDPAWHGYIANEMKTMEVESWLHSIDRPDGTKLKIKGSCRRFSPMACVGSLWIAIRSVARVVHRVTGEPRPGSGRATQSRSNE